MGVSNCLLYDGFFSFAVVRQLNGLFSYGLHYGLRAAARAGAIFLQDSVRIRLCTAASAVGGMMGP